MNKLVIAGGTGFLGNSLIDYFGDRFEEVVVLTRHARSAKGRVRYVAWDAETLGPWARELEGAELVINLCGKSVDCRYTKANREVIFSSRLDSTAIMGKAISQCGQAPGLWINAASATIYRHSEDTPMTEAGGEIGTGFSVEVCKAWERVFETAATPRTRKLNLRIGLALGMEGGVLPKLLQMVKLGLGGTMGNGRQLVSWLHVLDFCRMVDWCLQNATVHCIYNCSAPQPVSNKNMMRLLRQELHRPIGLPAAAWMLEIGAFVMRTETELMLKSRYAVPARAEQEGFEFKYKDFGSCIKDLIRA